MLAAGTTHAATVGQVGITATLESQYSFRGASLSYGRPDARLTLSYDRGGLYGGLSGIAVSDADGRVRLLGGVVYGGYAVRDATGTTWDAGFTATRLTARATLTYGELYAGFSRGNLSGRLSWSPRYLGQDQGTVYAELNSSLPLSPRWRLVGHAGMLTPLSGEERQQRFDVRAGVAATIGPCDLQLTWTGSTPRRNVRYAWLYPHYRDGLIASVSTAF